MPRQTSNTIQFLFVIVLLSLFFGCPKKAANGGGMVQVNMSKEHDSKRFDPSAGDKICIAGDFDNWTPDSLFLEDADGDWNYSIELPSSVMFRDTLIFRFKITPGSGRALENDGWEGIPKRKIPVSEFSSEKPVSLTFNEPFDDSKTANVTFTVGTRNQQILGFFDPKKGDEIIVSGSFCNWRADGYPMTSTNDEGVYTATLPIKFPKDKSVEYKFRILDYRKAILPNRGWETIQNRKVDFSGVPDVRQQSGKSTDDIDLPYAEFNDLRRVARFIVHTEKFESRGVFVPKRGDILQVLVVTDGKEALSDPLMKVARQEWEIAMAIPLTAQKVSWRLIKNLSIRATQLEDVTVGPEGKLIEIHPD